MIRFELVPEPAGFDRRARVPGNAWLAAHPDADRPKDYWTPFKGELAAGFHNLCAYSAMHEPVGTVDHFISCHEDRSKAYERENYRYCAAWINSSKGNVPAGDLLDPHEVEEGWFELLLAVAATAGLGRRSQRVSRTRRVRIDQAASAK